jgi:DNA replication protein DnaC
MNNNQTAEKLKSMRLTAMADMHLNQLKSDQIGHHTPKELKKLAKTELLILDNFGLQAFDTHAREALMDIIDDRLDQNSTMIASQIPVSV